MSSLLVSSSNCYGQSIFLQCAVYHRFCAFYSFHNGLMSSIYIFLGQRPVYIPLFEDINELYSRLTYLLLLVFLKFTQVYELYSLFYLPSSVLFLCVWFTRDKVCTYVCETRERGWVSNDWREADVWWWRNQNYAARVWSLWTTCCHAGDFPCVHARELVPNLPRDLHVFLFFKPASILYRHTLYCKNSYTWTYSNMLQKEINTTRMRQI